MEIGLERKKSKGVPAFLKKTYEILQNPSNWDSIRWAENGVGFIVLNEQKFSKYILPKYFKHSNYSSFVRQLNMYNFHKMRQGTTESYFYHQYFLQSDLNSISYIRRKPQIKKRRNNGQTDQDCDDEVSICKQKNNYQKKRISKDKSEKKVSLENTMQVVGSEEDPNAPQNKDNSKNILSMEIDDDKFSINQQINERCPRFQTRQLIYPSNHLLPYPSNPTQMSNFCLLP